MNISKYSTNYINTNNQPKFKAKVPPMETLLEIKKVFRTDSLYEYANIIKKLGNDELFVKFFSPANYYILQVYNDRLNCWGNAYIYVDNPDDCNFTAKLDEAFKAYIRCKMSR